MISTEMPVGLVPLGGNTPQALKRFANYISAYLKTGHPIPQSPLIEWIAERITGDDKLDVICMIARARGSGKSYSALYLGEKISKRVAEMKGGIASDYFNPTTNCLALEDSYKVAEILNGVRKHSVLICDDASVAAGNRSWNSPGNRNMTALIATCRTSRCCLIFTVPAKRMIDCHIRDMVDLTLLVYHPFHKDGFNILKAYRDSTGLYGKAYSQRVSVERKKVDFWVTLKPSDETTLLYDKQREESAKRLNQRIIETGSYATTQRRKKPEKPDKDAGYLTKFGKELTEYLKNNPTASANAVACEFEIHYTVASRLMKKVRSTGV